MSRFVCFANIDSLTTFQNLLQTPVSVLSRAAQGNHEPLLSLSYLFDFCWWMRVGVPFTVSSTFFILTHFQLAEHVFASVWTTRSNSATRCEHNTNTSSPFKLICWTWNIRVQRNQCRLSRKAADNTDNPKQTQKYLHIPSRHTLYLICLVSLFGIRSALTSCIYDHSATQFSCREPPTT